MKIIIGPTIGRPADTVHGTLTGVGRGGRAISWCDSDWAGHPLLVDAAAALARERAFLPLPLVEIEQVGRDAREPEPPMLDPEHAYTQSTHSDPVAALAILADPSVLGPTATITGTALTGLLDVLFVITAISTSTPSEVEEVHCV